jgi:hypothetical protein
LDAAYFQIDLVRQRPHRFANLVYAWCVERVDPERLEEWQLELADLLPWQEDAESAAAAAAESDSFLAMQARGGG